MTNVSLHVWLKPGFFISGKRVTALEPYHCGLYVPRNRAKQGTLNTKILNLEATPQTEKQDRFQG